MNAGFPADQDAKKLRGVPLGKERGETRKRQAGA